MSRLAEQIHIYCIAMDLTDKQLSFLKAIINFQARSGVPPSTREMQEFGGFRSPRSVTQFLDVLERGGFITRKSGARNVRILKRPPGTQTDRADTVLVPLVGRVAAGQPILAVQNVEDRIPVSATLVRNVAACFLLRVKGDSMNQAAIQDGDLVLVRPRESADSGEIVVALIDDDATVKRLRLAGDVIVLEPVSDNPKNKPIIVNGDFRIQGVVVATIPGGKE